MKIFHIDQKTIQDNYLLQRSDFSTFFRSQTSQFSKIFSVVDAIIGQVRERGDEALIELTNKFDKTIFVESSELAVSEDEILSAEKILADDVKSALKLAFKRIWAYHLRQMPSDFHFCDEEGATLGNEWRAIQSVGVYVPGGSASYPSSVLMSVIPALVAGVSKISICVPSNAGLINPATLFAAKICGVKKIYKIGGAQAVAALAFGTEIVNKVDKICGPGNSYVAAAKKMLFGEVGIDMIAGPTDLTVIADKNANPSWAACDVLSQLEHGPDSRAFVITDNSEFIEKFLVQIDEIAPTLPRYEIIAQSLKNSAILEIISLADAPKIVDFIAPEHLQINTSNAHELAKKVNNAGAIFLGEYSPEAIGDYIAGPSHTLPTSGTSNFASGLSVYDFLKRVSTISCSQKSFFALADFASILADCEGLHAHKLSIDIRSKNRS